MQQASLSDELSCAEKVIISASLLMKSEQDTEMLQAPLTDDCNSAEDTEMEAGRKQL